jgi:MerC mercury resistance protein
MQGKWLDGMAIGASLLCLLHCLALPLIIFMLPLVGALLSDSEWFHPTVLVFAIPTSLYALWSGFRAHCQPRSLILGVVGLSCLILGLWLEHISAADTVLTVAGSMLLATGHFQNLRLTTG